MRNENSHIPDEPRHIADCGETIPEALSSMGTPVCRDCQHVIFAHPSTVDGLGCEARDDDGAPCGCDCVFALPSEADIVAAARDVVAWFDYCAPDMRGPRIERLRSLLPPINWRDAITVAPIQEATRNERG